MCDAEEVVVARHARRIWQLEVEAGLRAEMRANPNWEIDDALDTDEVAELEAAFGEQLVLQQRRHNPCKLACRNIALLAPYRGAGF